MKGAVSVQRALQWTKIAGRNEGEQHPLQKGSMICMRKPTKKWLVVRPERRQLTSGCDGGGLPVQRFRKPGYLSAACCCCSAESGWWWAWRLLSTTRIPQLSSRLPQLPSQWSRTGETETEEQLTPLPCWEMRLAPLWSRPRSSR